MTANAAAPIFVVGLPRSGTTLLTAFLSSHSAICAGPETHFYNKFLPCFSQLNEHDTKQAWPQNALDILLSIKTSNQSIVDLYGINTDDLLLTLHNMPSTASSVLQAIMQHHCDKYSKAIWLEKTPNHILHLSHIRADFPEAKIIRIARDARDVAASMKKLPWAYQSLLANACTIDNWHRQSQSFFETDSNSYSIKFEDLLQDPQNELNGICEFINIPFENNMMARQHASGLASYSDEPWKEAVLTDLAPSKAQNWQRAEAADKTIADVHRMIENICGGFQSGFVYLPPTSTQNGALSHQTHVRDAPLNLVQVKESRFAQLDALVKYIYSRDLIIKNCDKAGDYLLVLEDNWWANIKLIVKCAHIRFFKKKTVLYIDAQKGSWFSTVLKSLFFSAI